jgi:hypothetical protein
MHLMQNVCSIIIPLNRNTRRLNGRHVAIQILTGRAYVFCIIIIIIIIIWKHFQINVLAKRITRQT